VVTAGQGKKPSLHSTLPHETQTGIAEPLRSAKKRRAAPILTQHFGLIGLGDSRDNAPVILDRPNHAAVLIRSAESPQIEDRALSPQRCVAPLVSSEEGEACYPTSVVYATAATAASEVIQIRDLILLRRSVL